MSVNDFAIVSAHDSFVSPYKGNHDYKIIADPNAHHISPRKGSGGDLDINFDPNHHIYKPEYDRHGINNPSLRDRNIHVAFDEDGWHPPSHNDMGIDHRKAPKQEEYMIIAGPDNEEDGGSMIRDPNFPPNHNKKRSRRKPHEPVPSPSNRLENGNNDNRVSAHSKDGDKAPRDKSHDKVRLMLNSSGGVNRGLDVEEQETQDKVEKCYTEFKKILGLKEEDSVDYNFTHNSAKLYSRNIHLKKDCFEDQERGTQQYDLSDKKSLLNYYINNRDLPLMDSSGGPLASIFAIYGVREEEVDDLLEYVSEELGGEEEDFPDFNRPQLGEAAKKIVEYIEERVRKNGAIAGLNINKEKQQILESLEEEYQSDSRVLPLLKIAKKHDLEGIGDFDELVEYVNLIVQCEGNPKALEKLYQGTIEKSEKGERFVAAGREVMTLLKADHKGSYQASWKEFKGKYEYDPKKFEAQSLNDLIQSLIELNDGDDSIRDEVIKLLSLAFERNWMPSELDEYLGTQFFNEGEQRIIKQIFTAINEKHKQLEVLSRKTQKLMKERIKPMSAPNGAYMGNKFGLHPFEITAQKVQGLLCGKSEESRDKWLDRVADFIHLEGSRREKAFEAIEKARGVRKTTLKTLREIENEKRTELMRRANANTKEEIRERQAIKREVELIQSQIQEIERTSMVAVEWTIMMLHTKFKKKHKHIGGKTGHEIIASGDPKAIAALANMSSKAMADILEQDNGREVSWSFIKNKYSVSREEKREITRAVGSLMYHLDPHHSEYLSHGLKKNNNDSGKEKNHIKRKSSKSINEERRRIERRIKNPLRLQHIAYQSEHASKISKPAIGADFILYNALNGMVNDSDGHSVPVGFDDDYGVRLRGLGEGKLRDIEIEEENNEEAINPRYGAINLRELIQKRVYSRLEEISEEQEIERPRREIERQRREDAKLLNDDKPLIPVDQIQDRFYYEDDEMSIVSNLEDDDDMSLMFRTTPLLGSVDMGDLDH